MRLFGRAAKWRFMEGSLFSSPQIRIWIVGSVGWIAWLQMSPACMSLGS